MIGVIDYGIGNIGSILNMLKKIGVQAKSVKTIEEVEKVDKLILPGVGSFDSGMQKLKASGLIESIIKHVNIDNKPLMGICLGMQMLGRGSEEGNETGLNLIPFTCKRFVFSHESELKVPHMGWDIISNQNNDAPILRDLDEKQRYYFVHSYYAVCDSRENELMICEYGFPFAAAVVHNNIYGFQFHPEKSHKFGMALLENFARRI